MRSELTALAALTSVFARKIVVALLRPIDTYCTHRKRNKSSAVAEMGDRGNNSERGHNSVRCHSSA